MNEIAFEINSQATLNQGCLVLNLMEVSRQGYSLIPQRPAEKRKAGVWRSLCYNSNDQAAFNFLLKEELQFQQKMTGKTPSLENFILDHFHLPPSQVHAALILLAATQKLYCNNKQLIVDLYGKTEFYYEGRTLDDGHLEIKGRLRGREFDLSLEECEALGPGKPHWFVRGITLKLIETHVPWKKLHELKNGPLLLAGASKQKFLEDLDSEDAASPQLIMKEGSVAEAFQTTQPLPLLILSDRWGACADLWMNYGQYRVASHDPHPFIKDEKQKNLCKRQMSVEASWEKDLLETDFIKKNVGSSHFYCALDKVAKSLTFLLELGWHIFDYRGRQVVKQTDLSLSFEEQQKMIAVKGHLNYDSHQADVSQVFGAFNRRENFIELTGDKVGLIPTQKAERALKDLMEESVTMGSERFIRRNRIGSLETVWEYAKTPQTLQSLKEQLVDFSGIQEALPSQLFQGNLRPYQQQGLNWLNFLHVYGFSGILADEMGLGKTVQVLAFLSRLKNGPHLIVMPTSLLFNWANEIKRFLPTFKCLIHQSGARAQTPKDLADFDIILTSYTLMRLDLPLFQQLSLTSLILDEAQVIKNASTQTAKAVCQLQAVFKLSITGTPIENHLSELWSQFHFLMPDLFATQADFEADILASQSDRRYLERIKKKFTPFLLRRKKEAVAKDLPERIDQVMWIEMSDEQRAIYDNLLAGFKKGLLKKVESEGLSKHRMEVLEAILRLRQVCCHPLLVSSLTESTSLVSAKFEALFQDLETLGEEGAKVLVYSQFTSMLQLMCKAAKERNWSFAYLDGTTPNREEVVNSFQNEASKSIFFISLKAGGVGLNLTAADYVYLYDPWWNEAVEEQAINRAHRIGQKKVVIAKRFIMLESIEEKMMKLKVSKKAMIEELMESNKLSDQITVDDLQFLLS